LPRCSFARVADRAGDADAAMRQLDAAHTLQVTTAARLLPELARL
jgi:hypothetical protein